VEIQNDSIGSGNIGMPPEVEGIPHDLVPSERARLYKDLLKGFRYARLAMGLYYRGLSADQKTIGPRYASQNTDLAELIAQSGMEGVAAEYFSPGPGWKSNNDWVQGSLKQFDPTFLGQFGDNAVTELQQLQSHSIPVKMWGLQNEPSATPTYSSAVYTRDQYYQTFKAVAPKIRAAFPQVLIHANSLDGQNEMGDYPGPITSDPDALKYLDAWTWHCIGCDSRKQMQQGGATASGKMVFNNEFEYLDKTTSPARLVNTAQSIMNWMTFNNSPTWFWLHALKPAGDTTAMGYGLGVWRKPADTDLTHWPNVQSGYFDYIPNNYNAIAGFLSYMPWNSTRYDVTEKDVSRDQRVMAWKTPAGKLVFPVTNRTGLDTGYRVNLPSSKNYTGYLFDSTPRNATQADGTGQYKGKPLGPKSGSVLDLLIPDLSIQFWVEN
jgi:O-glycosyl hydrolase